MHKPIIIKTPQQINNITESGKYLDELLQSLNKMSQPGVNLMELEFYAESFLKKNKINGAFKGYMGYPANLCLSVNDGVVHGIPIDYDLRPGDLLKIDVGVTYNKGITDAAISIVIGGPKTNLQAQKLVDSTKNALDDSLRFVQPGMSIYEFGNNIYENITRDGFSVIKNLTGHGVGNHVHEGPYIYNYPVVDAKNILLKENMVIALEPITAEKSSKVYEDSNDSWSLYTDLGDLGAQREYTVLVTSSGYKVLAGIR